MQTDRQTTAEYQAESANVNFVFIKAKIHWQPSLAFAQGFEQPGRKIIKVLAVLDQTVDFP